MKTEYKTIWSPESLKQIKRLRKKLNAKDAEKYILKIANLINDIQSNPFKGIGKPEHLKYKIPPCWSRRINLKDRLIYRVTDNRIEVISILGHYD